MSAARCCVCGAPSPEGQFNLRHICDLHFGAYMRRPVHRLELGAHQEFHEWVAAQKNLPLGLAR